MVSSHVFIHPSCSHHLEQVLRALLENDAKADATEEDGFTALMFSAQNGHDLCARALLENGGDLEKQQNQGYTALMIAAQNGHEQVRNTQHY